MLKFYQLRFENQTVDGELRTSEEVIGGGYRVSCRGPKQWEASRGMFKVRAEPFKTADEAERACQEDFEVRLSKYVSVAALQSQEGKQP